ncbi:hypothetical protein L596_026891 [Steinernema carpocapsae]|uniref:CUB domain-containing protein n=1 Tax=Steinernema carpocapsae TaxID=34508 RepID=A0A4U5M2U8_STECR|nr:hypothetical protein L596_026891 [Steinernema carpocapsae]
MEQTPFWVCYMQFNTTVNQRFVVTFLNAKASVIFQNNMKNFKNIDTNYIIAAQSYTTPTSTLILEVFDNSDLDYFTQRSWSGFEAIVTAYNTELNQCPCETKNGPVEIDEASPVYVSSHYDLSSIDAFRLPPLNCSWKFTPKAGQILKLALNVFTLQDSKEKVSINIDGADTWIDFYGLAYPGGANKNLIEVTMDIFVEEMGPTGTLEVYEEGYIVKNHTKANSDTETYKTEAVGDVTLKYAGSLADKGFFVRYHLDPVNGATVLGLSLIALLMALFQFWV